MALNQQLRDASALLAEGINTGSGSSRANLGGGGTAFGWAGGLVRTVASYDTVAEADGMTFGATFVTESATPAAIVAAAAPKPAAAQVTSGSVQLVKFAGIATLTLEQQLDADGLASAVASVIGASALRAFEADSIAVLDAGSGSTVTGGDWVAATAAAQAAILSNGGSPSVLVVSAADYANFVGDVLGTSAFSQDPDSPIGALLGSLIHVSPSAPAGKGYLFDSSAVVSVQHSQSPLVILDAVSMADTNQARIVIDLVAKTFIADPAFVIEISAPLGAAASSSAAKRK